MSYVLFSRCPMPHLNNVDSGYRFRKEELRHAADGASAMLVNEIPVIQYKRS